MGPYSCGLANSAGGSDATLPPPPRPGWRTTALVAVVVGVGAEAWEQSSAGFLLTFHIAE